MDHGVQQVLANAKQRASTPVIEGVHENRLVWHLQVQAAVLFVDGHAAKEQVVGGQRLIAVDAALGQIFLHLNDQRAKLGKELLRLAKLAANLQIVHVGVVVEDGQAWILLEIDQEVLGLGRLLARKRRLLFLLDGLFNFQQHLLGDRIGHRIRGDAHLLGQRLQLSGRLCTLGAKGFLQLLGDGCNLCPRLHARHGHDALERLLQTSGLVATRDLAKICLHRLNVFFEPALEPLAAVLKRVVRVTRIDVWLDVDDDVVGDFLVADLEPVIELIHAAGQHAMLRAAQLALYAKVDVSRAPFKVGLELLELVLGEIHAHWERLLDGIAKRLHLDLDLNGPDQRFVQRVNVVQAPREPDVLGVTSLGVDVLLGDLHRNSGAVLPLGCWRLDDLEVVVGDVLGRGVHGHAHAVTHGVQLQPISAQHEAHLGQAQAAATLTWIKVRLL